MPPKRTPRVQTHVPWPLFRMFGLGIVAVFAVIWAVMRPKQVWHDKIAPPPGEIEVDLWDGGT